MRWFENLPFVMIWLPMALSAVTAVLPAKHAHRVMIGMPLLGCVLSGVLLYELAGSGTSFCYRLGEFGAPFGNELRAGPLEALMALTFCLVLLLSLLGGYKRILVQVRGSRHSLYAVMVLLLQAALMAEVFTNDLFTGYVFIEIMTIAACALVAARLRGRTLFAATKYMIMNLLGSGLFLLGLSVIYCLTGELLMSDIHARVSELIASGLYRRPLMLSLALMTVGIAVKSALYPFHAWLPDAYASTTPSSSAMLSSLVSKAYIFLYAKVVLRVYGLDTFHVLGIRPVLLVFSAVGILLGSIDAILEKKLRRMIAYSSVAQIGYIWLGIAVGTEAGAAAAMFHMIVHALAKSALFLSGDRLIGASDGDASFHELRGAGYRAPLSAACFTVSSCSIVGIPLLGGFASKIILAKCCMDLEERNAVLALIVLAISTALNAAYFLITVVTIYEKPQHDYHTRLDHPKISTAAIAVLACLLLFTGIFARDLLDLISRGVALMM